MSLHRQNAARDANEAEIVDALRTIGCSVIRLSEKGIPDLLVGFKGNTFLLEVKLPLGTKGGKSHSDLTKDQQAFFDQWRGKEPCVVRSVDEAMAAVSAWDLPKIKAVYFVKEAMAPGEKQEILKYKCTNTENNRPEKQ
jgi:Holliday junction resolvase